MLNVSVGVDDECRDNGGHSNDCKCWAKIL